MTAAQPPTARSSDVHSQVNQDPLNIPGAPQPKAVAGLFPPGDPIAGITPDLIERTFSEWDRRFREDPEAFMSEATRILTESPTTYGMACTPYFLTILQGLQAGPLESERRPVPVAPFGGTPVCRERKFALLTAAIVKRVGTFWDCQDEAAWVAECERVLQLVAGPEANANHLAPTGG